MRGVPWAGMADGLESSPVKKKCPLPCPSNVIRLEITNQGGITMSQFVYLYRGAERGQIP